MKKYVCMLVLLLICVVTGCIILVINNTEREINNQQEKTTTETVIVPHVVSKENLYASVQHNMEWGLYEQFADYYLNYMSKEQTEYYNRKATVKEIHETLKQIYAMSFDYNNIELKEDVSKIELSVPVQIMNHTYRYVYIGEVEENQTYVFHKACLFQEDGNDIFGDMEYSYSVKVKPKEKDVIIQESALNKPNEEYVAYYALWEYLNQDECMVGDAITEGIYYHNGNKNSDYYVIRDDRQIAISTRHNELFHFKTMKINGKNHLYYLYNLKGCGIDGGYQIEYTNDRLIVDGEVYELEKRDKSQEK